MDKMLLYFSAPWCTTCQYMTSIVNELSSEINLRIVNIDEEKEFALKYQLEGFPAFVMVDENMQETIKLYGGRTKEEIIEMYNS